MREEVASVGRVAQVLLEVEGLPDQPLDVELRIAHDLTTLRRDVAQKPERFVGPLGAWRGHLLDLRRGRAQGQQVHAAQVLQRLQKVVLFLQQAAETDLLQPSDAHEAPSAACLRLEILERTTAAICSSER